MGAHHQRHGGAAAAFRWSVLLNALLTGAQLAIGFGFGSLALIGDAIHNLGDVVGLLLAWGAERLSLRPARGRFTYGYGRSTHLAALINGLLVFAAGLLVVVEGWIAFSGLNPWWPAPLRWRPPQALRSTCFRLDSLAWNPTWISTAGPRCCIS